MTHRTLFLGALSALALSLSGCGDDVVEACPSVDYETHLDQATSASGAVTVMVHHADRACLGVGANLLRFHDVTASGGMTMHDMHEGMSPSFIAAAVHKDPAELVAVSAMMPAHGHGTSVDPEIDPDNPADVLVHFSMPGDWELMVDLKAPATTDTTESFVFHLTVEN